MGNMRREQRQQRSSDHVIQTCGQSRRHKLLDTLPVSATLKIQ
jgi:hypothetical protein